MEGFLYLIFFLTMLLLLLREHHMEHHTQQMGLPRYIDHQNFARLLTPCRTNVQPTNLKFNIASTNHQHITTININHSTQDCVDHRHRKHHNNSLHHLLDLELSKRTALRPRPTLPQAVTTHKTNCLLRPQHHPMLSQEYHNYRP